MTSRKRAAALVLLLTSLGLSGCLTSDFLFSNTAGGNRRHAEFTTASQLELVWGLAPEEIEKRFGPPDRTSVEMRGTKTDSPWQAIVYEYLMGKHPNAKYQYIDNVNSFAFNFEHRSLEYWDIQLAYPENEPTISAETSQREILFYNGKYYGSTSHGMPNGKGRFEFSSGLIYEGDWQQGKRTGEGINFYLSGDKYIGHFLDGRPSGGIYIFSDGTEHQSYMDEQGEWHPISQD